MMASAIANASGCTSDSGMPSCLERALEQVRDRRLAEVAEAERADGDAELRRGHHQRDVLHRRERRPRGPAAACGARLDRAAAAEISANSAPTKNALAASSTTEMAIAAPVLMALLLPCRRRSVRGASDAVDAEAVQQHHGSTRCGARLAMPRSRPGRRSRGRARAGRVDEPGERLVLVVLGQPDAGPGRDLVGTQQAGQVPAALALAAHRVVARVVLVAHVADDLLDQVLERDDPVDVAPLVDDDAHLEPAAAQRRQQRIELQARRHEHRLDHHSRTATRSRSARADRHRVLDVHPPDHVVAVRIQHGKARAAAGAGLRSTATHRRVGPKRPHASPRRHHVGGAAPAERQRAFQQRRRRPARACPARPSAARARLSSSGERADASSSCGSMPSAAGSRSRCR